MLIAGIDEQGCHLYQTCPSGNLYNHIAAAIGKTKTEHAAPPLLLDIPDAHSRHAHLF